MTVHQVAAVRPKAVSAGALVRALRPRQWLKNLLVLTAPLASGQIVELRVAAATAAAFLAFCCASSAIYLLNDVRDVDADRRHERKRHRPVASGDLAAPMALAASATLAATSLVIAALATSGPFVLLLTAYLVVMAGYCLWWRAEPVIDLAIIALGFLGRGIAGGVAAGIVLSNWFLIVAGFGALFIAAGKRYSEAMSGTVDARRVLESYTVSFLRTVWTLAVAVTVVGYCLWAFEMSADRQGAPWAAISVVPFLVAVLRYARTVDAGRAEEPEAVVLADRPLLGLGLLWLVFFALGAFGAG
ncbi:MAG TPA: decaprenyl-phosphate phosphoribosyltransferase [Cryptosporangiaceae bacterium]|nr:decaprenyl-phosphate phosphoribosyltransferase [Cryptosporangiaceae bacterium]